jgi:hypothetical protein
MSEDYGTTAKFTQFTTVLAVVQSALATVVGKIGIKQAIEATKDRTDEVVPLLHAVFLSLRSGQKLVFEPTPAEQAEVFMTLELGLLNLDQLNNQLSWHMGVSDHAREITRLTGFKLQKKRKLLELVKVSVFQLGFTEPPTYNEICLRAMDLGYSLCPSETAPLMYMAYPARRSRILFATLELSDSTGGIGLFEVGNQDIDPYLSVTSAHPNCRFPLDTEFVFTVPSEVDF